MTMRIPAYITIVASMTLTTSSTQAQEPGAAQPPTSSAPVRTGYIPANGINYYYEIRGTGEPLLLLHGGLGSIDMFGPLLPMLAEKRQVIGVDLHGHGRTELGTRPVNLIDMGNDLAVILSALGYDSVDVLGYSMGAGAGFRLAVQHPQLVRRLALVSGSYASDGFHAEMRPLQKAVSGEMAESMKETPMYQSYVAIAPKPEDFPRLLDTMGDLMREEFDWGEDVEKLKMPVMLVYGDSDMYRLEHVMDFYHQLGGGLRDGGWMRENVGQNRLAILPGLTHYELFMAPAMVRAVMPFLDDDFRAPSWADQVGGR